MRLRKPLITCLLSLVLVGCTLTVEDHKTSASSKPATTNSAAAFAPVKEGEQSVFTDPDYGYSIRFSDDFQFKANPELMKLMQEKAGASSDIDMKSVTFRFILSLGDPDSIGFTPNLNGTVEQVSKEAGIQSTEQYMESARAILEQMIKTKLTKPSDKVKVNGVEFYRTQYQVTPPGAPPGVVLSGQIYSYYDPENFWAYNFGATSRTEDEDSQKRLEQVLQTIKLKQ